jgi:hypothetical protein
VRRLKQIERIQQFDRTPRRANSAVGEVQVTRRGFQALVAQQSLNHKQIDTVFEQMRGKGVPERMWMDWLCNTGDPCGPSAGQEHGFG